MAALTLVDANVLLYAYDSGSRHHLAAKRWLESALSSPAPIRLPWVSILAFLRISTSRRILSNPLSLDEALAIVDAWLARPMCAPLVPTDTHWGQLRETLSSSAARGALVTDAHLAAIAVEHGAAICTFDRDFARFEGVRIIRPE